MGTGNARYGIGAARTGSDADDFDVVRYPAGALGREGRRLLVVRGNGFDAGMVADAIVEMHRASAADGEDAGGQAGDVVGDVIGEFQWSTMKSLSLAK